MSGQSKLILWFEEVDKHDVDLVGGKGANLGELVQAGIPVPPGFNVTATAYRQFIARNKLDRFIRAALGALDPEDTKTLQAQAKVVQEKILATPLAHDLTEVITEAYQQLVLRPGGSMDVAVRSSATAEDLPEASFAGQQATFLNVRGADQVVAAVRKAWASLFTARAIYYRSVNHFDHLKVAIATPVQAMVEADVAVILFTIDPVSNDTSVITIDAAYGLGEAVVSGSLTPDRYVVEKKTWEIVEKDIATQTWKIARQPGSNKTGHVAVPANQQRQQKLTDDQVVALAKLGARIEAHYQFPQDTEWTVKDGEIFFVQARPVTTVTKQVPVKNAGSTQLTKAELKARPLLEGGAASLGIASGPIRILHSPDEIDKLAVGDILVAEMTSPDYVPAMKRASAIITDAGGRTSHAAIVSRELGIPAVVGTGTATHILHDGQVVTVDGANGKVYLGKLALSHKEAAAVTPKRRGAKRVTAPPHTATNIYVNLAEPSLATKISKKHVDGVGLLRAEFMIAEMGEHPAAMVKRGARAEYVTKLADGMEQFTKAFHPHPVVYRGSDFKTNEYRSLKGGEEFEPHEENPMIGYRGAQRYLADPDLFRAELEAIKEVRGRRGFENLWLMIPFVRTVEQMRQVRTMVEQTGLIAERTFKLWMMVEVPSNVILIDEFLDVGIDGISIGTNDLTQLTLGVDRDNAKLQDVFDERDPAVIKSVQKVIKAVRAKRKTASICGQAPSTYPEFAEMAIKAGITSLSVNPDAIDSVRELAASVEKQMDR